MITEPPALTVDQPIKRPTQQQIASFKDVPSGLVADAMGGRGAMSSDIRLVNLHKTACGTLPAQHSQP